MTFFIFLFLFLFLTIVLIHFDVVNTNRVGDVKSPLNFILFQPPKNKYNQQLVNLWIDKTWRNDSSRIPCRFELSSKPKNQKDRYIVIYSHGNNEDILQCGQFLKEISDWLDVDILTWDYSGYGLNEFDNYERTAEGINMSLDCIVNHVVTHYRYSYDHIIFWGYSLGSGPSIYMASKLHREKIPAGLILFGAYSSIKELIKYHTNERIANYFEERWNSVRNITSVKCPILIMHGQNDRLIPSYNAESLKRANPQNAKLVLLPNIGHQTFSWQDSIKIVHDWLQEKQIIKLTENDDINVQDIDNDINE